jgi:RNA polymerase sigma factor (sigma-70 family)
MSISNTGEMTEEQLVSGCIKAEPAAQEQLYKRFSRKMFGVCLRYTSSREEAEDLLQEAFVTVFGKLSSFKNEGSLEGWIRRIVVNTVLQSFRKQRIALVETEELPEAAAPEGMSMETKELLMLIQSLPTGYRTVFNLYAIEGYTHLEIANMLGINENTSKSQYSRARAQLMNTLRSRQGAQAENEK